MRSCWVSAGGATDSAPADTTLDELDLKPPLDYTSRVPSPWVAEWPCPPDLAIALIEASWPELAPARAAKLPAGWDNAVYRINDRYIFRFPTRRVAVPLMSTEIAVLPWLACRLPIAIPHPVFVGAPSERYPYAFAGYALIRGRTFNAARPAEGKRNTLAVSLARFLSSLHAVSVDEARQHGAPDGDGIGKLDFRRYRETTRSQLDALVSRGVLAAATRSRIDAITDELPVIEDPAKDTLVHGDLHGNQILVDAEDGLAGVVDWGDLHCGDPALDLAAVHVLFAEAAQTAFLREYGRVDPACWAAAKGRAIWHTLWLLSHAVAVGDEATVLECRSCLERLTEARGSKGLGSGSA